MLTTNGEATHNGQTELSTNGEEAQNRQTKPGSLQQKGKARPNSEEAQHGQEKLIIDRRSS